MIADIIKQYKGVFFELKRTNNQYLINLSYNGNSIMFYEYIKDCEYNGKFKYIRDGFKYITCYECGHKHKESKYKYIETVSKDNLTERDKKQQRRYVADIIFSKLKSIGYEGKKVL